MDLQLTVALSPPVTYTHNSWSRISSLSSFKANREFQITYKTIECSLLDFALFFCQAFVAASLQLSQQLFLVLTLSNLSKVLNLVFTETITLSLFMLCHQFIQYLINLNN